MWHWTILAFMLNMGLQTRQPVGIHLNIREVIPPGSITTLDTWVTPTRVLYPVFNSRAEGNARFRIYFWDTSRETDGSNPRHLSSIFLDWFPRSFSISSNGKNILFGDGSQRELYSSQGSLLMRNDPLVGGIHTIRWFPDHNRWLEETIFTPPIGVCPSLITIGELRTKQMHLLLDSSDKNSLLRLQTRAVAGSGKSLFTLEFEDSPVAPPQLWDTLEPMKSVLLSEFRLEPKYERRKVHLEEKAHGHRLKWDSEGKIPVQYASMVRKQRIFLPIPLCVEEVVFSPNCKRLLWLCYDPKSISSSVPKMRDQRVYVSGEGIQGFHLLKEWKSVQNFNSLSQIGWRGNDTDVYCRGASKLVLIHVE